MAEGLDPQRQTEQIARYQALFVSSSTVLPKMTQVEISEKKFFGGPHILWWSFVRENNTLTTQYNIFWDLEKFWRATHFVAVFYEGNYA